MGLLGTLRGRLVHATFRHRELVAVATGDDVARLAHRHAGHRRRVGPHVGDQPDLALGRLDTLIQPLGDRHRALRAERQLAAGLLLEGRRGERRRRRSLLGADADLADDRMRFAQGRDVPLGRGLVGQSQRLAVDPDQLGGERVARGGREDGLDRPVLTRREGFDLALALDDEPDGDRLDAAGRQPATDLARQQRAQRVADEPVDDAACLLGVDEVAVDVARVRERLADRRLGDLAERDASRLLGRDVGRLGHVPGDRLALAVEVGRQIDQLRALGGLGDVVDLLAAVLVDDVFGEEPMVDVHAELALPGVLGEVADVTVGGEDAIVVAQIALDRPRLRRRLDDHEVLGHGRDISTGSFAHPCRTRRRGGVAVEWDAAFRPRGCASGSPRRSRARRRRRRPRPAAARARRRPRGPASPRPDPCRRRPAAGSRRT